MTIRKGLGKIGFIQMRVGGMRMLMLKGRGRIRMKRGMKGMVSSSRGHHRDTVSSIMESRAMDIRNRESRGMGIRMSLEAEVEGDSICSIRLDLGISIIQPKRGVEIRDRHRR